MKNGGTNVEAEKTIIVDVPRSQVRFVGLLKPIDDNYLLLIRPFPYT